MADAYKGLVIEIDGNTTKLSASLRSVQSDIRGTQSALKDVSKALKLDPGNVELTEQRFRLATKAVAAQEEKLAQLERASAEYGSRQGQLTDEEQAGYDKVQREIARTKAALEGARKELEQAERQSTALGQALAKAGGRLTEFSDKYSAVADGAESVGTKVATTAVGIGTAAYGALTQVEDGCNVAIRSAGAVGDAADEIRRSVRAVATQAPGDLATVGQAVGDVNTHFQVQGDELDRISTAFLKYSKVTGQDVSTAVEQVAMSMKAFNVDASEAGEVLDYIAQVSTATGISAQTLTADLNSSGSTLREMGLTLQDGVKLLGDFEAAGVPADQMLTGLKKAAANCAKENVDLSDRLRQLVADLQDPERQAKATQDAIDLFGSKAAMAFVDAARSGRVNLDDLGQSLGSAKGFVSDLKDETTTASDRVQGAIKKMTVAGSGIGEQFVPIVEKAADAVTDAAEAIGGMSDGEREAAAGAVKAAAGLGGMLVVAGKTVKGMGSLGKTITTLSTTGLLGPTGLVVAGTAAAAVIGGSLYAAYEKTKKSAENAENLQKATSGLTDATTKLAPTLDAAAQSLDGASDGYEGTAKSLEDLLRGQAELAESIRERNEEAQTSISRLQGARDAIDELAGKSDLSATEQGRLGDAIKLVNDECGTQYGVVAGTSQVIDENTGSVLENTDAIDENIRKRQESIRQEAMSETLSDLYRQQAEDLKTLTQAQRDLAEAQRAQQEQGEKLAGMTDEQRRAYMETSGDATDYAAAISDATDAVSKAQSAYDATTQSIDGVNEALGNSQLAAEGASVTVGQYASTMNGVQSAVEDGGHSLQEFSDALDDSGVSMESFESLTASQLSELVAGFDGSAGSIVDKLREWGVQTNEVVGEAGSQWIASLDGTAQQALQSVQGMTGTTVRALQDAAQQSGQSGSDVASLFAQGIADGSLAVDSSAQQIADYVTSRTSQAAADAGQDGADAAAGAASGIWSGSGAVDSAAASAFGQMASRATEAARGAASASSQGAADSAAAVSSQSEAMSSAAAGLFGQLPSWAESRSGEARGSIASGVSSMEGSVSGARLVLPSIQMPHIPQLHVEGGFSVSSSGISLPRISFYAHGGRATRPTMAVVAEAGEPENMIPDSKLSGFMLKALKAAGYEPGRSGGTVVNQTFSTKVVRADADLYAAAPAIYRNAMREARSRA